MICRNLLRGILRSRQEELALGLAGALRKRMEVMRSRLERLEGRAEQKRVLVTTAMQEAGLKKLVAPEFTASLRSNPGKLIVTDETLIPAEFWVVPPPRLDRQQLFAAVRAGRHIPGAVLANPEPSLTIRGQ